MKQLTVTFAAAALALGTLGLRANAQTQQPTAASFHAQMIQNATPIVKQAACRGWGGGCGPGWFLVCRGLIFRRCWCRPCY
jgi:hypothetical protein